MPAPASGPSKRARPVSPKACGRSRDGRRKREGHAGSWGSCQCASQHSIRETAGKGWRCRPPGPSARGKKWTREGRPSGSFVVAVCSVVGGRAVALLLQHALRRLAPAVGAQQLHQLVLGALLQERHV